MSLELNYKAKNVANAERATGLKLFEALNGMGGGNIGMTDLVFLLQAGGASEEAAYDEIDNKGLTGALEGATEALGKAGFLQGANPVAAKVRANAKAQA